VRTSRLVVVAHGAWVQWRVTPVSKSLLACKQRGPVITGLHALVILLNMRSAGIIGGARSCCVHRLQVWGSGREGSWGRIAAGDEWGGTEANSAVWRQGR
jgi:hypothetical protein